MYKLHYFQHFLLEDNVYIDHLMNYHVNNLEQYMAEGDPDILIELYKFIENIRDEVLKEPNHP